MKQNDKPTFPLARRASVPARVLLHNDTTCEWIQLTDRMNAIQPYPPMPRIDAGNPIPADVFAAILAKAASDHPHDYCTQLYVIKNQVAAYLEVSKFTSSN